MCDIAEALRLQSVAFGLRQRWRCPGEAWSAVVQPLGAEWETADNVEMSSWWRKWGRLTGSRRERTRNELTERAILFLVDARAARGAVVFGVRANGRRRDFTRCRRVNDACDAGRSCLRERGSEDPPTDNSRNASTHSVVSCGREAREM